MRHYWNPTLSCYKKTANHQMTSRLLQACGCWGWKRRCPWGIKTVSCISALRRIRTPAECSCCTYIVLEVTLNDSQGYRYNTATWRLFSLKFNAQQASIATAYVALNNSTESASLLPSPCSRKQFAPHEVTATTTMIATQDLLRLFSVSSERRKNK